MANRRSRRELAWVRSLPVGRFTGGFCLRWLGPERFRYLPDDDPLTFHRANGEVITPGEMETDGGTITPVLQVLSGMSRWSYACAFMIHDWEWENRLCNGKSFKEVNLTLAEAMRTMQVMGVLPDRSTDIINVYRGVMSVAARRQWHNNSPYPGPATRRIGWVHRSH
ncbi:MAG TPA: hypothetical protein PKA21_08930 [Kiritimatiellia bacterium]|nr:hypothetical protein [Kiritimatiellia bacterium]